MKNVWKRYTNLHQKVPKEKKSIMEPLYAWAGSQRNKLCLFCGALQSESCVDFFENRLGIQVKDYNFFELQN